MATVTDATTLEDGVADRLEIPKGVKLLVFKRAGGPDNLICEGCGFPIGGKAFHYDHSFPEYLQNTPKSERKPIIAEDVKLLGWECCHREKSSQEHKANCHGKRIVAKTAKAQKRKSRPMPGSRDSPWKKTFAGWKRRGVRTWQD